MEQVKINSFELENVKRIKAVKLDVTPNGLTVIGGDNNQGKTSVLDSIAWMLGGDRYRPSEPNRTGSTIPAHLKLKLNNGIIVERSGKNGSLKITDSNGNKGGQQLLNEFINAFALDLPKFMNSTNKEKADLLLRIIGVGDQLAMLERDEKKLYDERHYIGTVAEQKKKFAQELTEYPDVGTELISITDLINQQQAILAKNGENQRKRQQKAMYENQYNLALAQFESASQKLKEAENNLKIAAESTAYLQDEDTSELEANIQRIDLINQHVRSNLEKERATDEANHYRKQYDDLTAKIENIRDEKRLLLEHADLPLPELSVREGELIYKNQKWDNMSGSEQLKVATAIVRKLNPHCGFVLVDKLEQMDLKSLSEFGRWLESEHLQAIGTRVSKGDECSIIIEDGYVVSEDKPTTNKWVAGEF